MSRWQGPFERVNLSSVFPFEGFIGAPCVKDGWHRSESKSEKESTVANVS